MPAAILLHLELNVFVPTQDSISDQLNHTFKGKGLRLHPIHTNDTVKTVPECLMLFCWVRIAVLVSSVAGKETDFLLTSVVDSLGDINVEALVHNGQQDHVVCGRVSMDDGLLTCLGGRL